MDVHSRPAPHAVDAGRGAGEPRRYDLSLRGPLHRGVVDDRPRGRLAALGDRGRPDARARPRGEGGRLARQLRQRHRRDDLLLLPLSLRHEHRVDARRARSRRSRGPPARERHGLPARARREVGLRHLPRGERGGNRRSFPLDRPARRPARRAFARLRRRRPAREREREPRRRASRRRSRASRRSPTRPRRRTRPGRTRRRELILSAALRPC